MGSFVHSSSLIWMLSIIPLTAAIKKDTILITGDEYFYRLPNQSTLSPSEKGTSRDTLQEEQSESQMNFQTSQSFREEDEEAAVELGGKRQAEDPKAFENMEKEAPDPCNEDGLEPPKPKHWYDEHEVFKEGIDVGEVVGHGVFDFKDGTQQPAGDHGVFTLMDDVVLQWMQLWPPPKGPPTKNELELGPQMEDENRQPPLFIFHHGRFGNLGKDNRFHWLLALRDTMKMLRTDKAPRCVLYGARGTMSSSGWQNGGVAQFNFKTFGFDMIQLSHHLSAGKQVILGGTGGGASIALWAATMMPRLVKGIVLHNVVKPWDLSAQYRADLGQQAMQYQDTDKDLSEFFFAMSTADAPPRQDLETINIPILLVTQEGTITYEESAISVLMEVLPKATKVIIDKDKNYHEEFSAALAEWYDKNF